MASVSISYRTIDSANHESERILGKETIDNIDEVLIPFSDRSVPMFITKAFTGEDCKRWRVERIEKLAKDSWCVWLKNQINTEDIYLSSTMSRKQIHNAQGIVKKGAIVIVEFGHIHQTLNFQSGFSKNVTYYCNHLSGEMHKRRAAIVVSADKRGVKVVPITSKEPDGFSWNNSIFELESQSTRQISEFNPGKKSYVLCEMIQTVSPARILPPLALDQRTSARTYRRDEMYNRKISKNDLAALSDGLLTVIGMSGLKKKTDTLTKDKEQINQAYEAANSQVRVLTAIEQQQREQLQLLQSKYEILANLYITHSGHRTVTEVDDEVSEYLA